MANTTCADAQLEANNERWRSTMARRLGKSIIKNWSMQKDMISFSKGYKEKMVKQSLSCAPAYGSKAASFTVVLCNLNEIMYIEQSLNSLRNQTLAPEEIILIDGGSTDGSLEVAKALADKVYGPVKGCARSRLLGVFASKGSLICSANSDTIYPKRYLENASRHLAKPEVMAVTGPHKPIPGTHFNLPAQAQAVFSYISYLMLPHVYEHNVCFKKSAFIKSMEHFRDYWRYLISSPRTDIGYYMRHGLNPRWEKDMLVYTRLPTRSVSVRKVLVYFFRYLRFKDFKTIALAIK